MTPEREAELREIVAGWPFVRERLVGYECLDAIATLRKERDAYRDGLDTKGLLWRERAEKAEAELALEWECDACGGRRWVAQEPNGR